MTRDWNTEERVHSAKVAAALNVMMALRPAVAGSVSFAGHLPEAIQAPGSPEFNEAVVAYEAAKDERDAFLDDRRTDDAAWRSGTG